MGNHDAGIHHPWDCYLLTLCDLFMPKTKSKNSRLDWVCGDLLALVSLLGLLDHDVTSILYDTFRLDAFAKAFKMIFFVGAALGDAA